LAAEQLTERLVSHLNQLGDWLRALPFKTVYKTLCGLLILWIVISLLQLIWFFIPTSSNDSTAPVAATAIQPGATASVDLAKLQSIALFGQAGAVAPDESSSVPVADEVELNATKTRLNLILEGIIHTSDSSSSVAVIVYQGKQDQYYIGDKLPVGNRVELARVLVDHVILDNAGNYESLWLYDDEKNASRAPVNGRRIEPKVVAREAVTDIRDDDDATELASDYRQRLYKNPSSLAEVLRIAPAQENGQLLGYRVSPGRDREQFAALGFENNDIVTSINGILLDEPSKALEVYKLMRTAKEATFTVDREGQQVDVMVSLGDE
jgi:general secretion pathway protein C